MDHPPMTSARVFLGDDAVMEEQEEQGEQEEELWADSHEAPEVEVEVEVDVDHHDDDVHDDVHMASDGARVSLDLVHAPRDLEIDERMFPNVSDPVVFLGK